MGAEAMDLIEGATRRAIRPFHEVVYGPRTQQVLDVSLGRGQMRVGVLRHVMDGPTECSEFTFAESWLQERRRFGLSPDLRPHTSGQWRKATLGHGSPFFAALADTLPDGFALAVLDRCLGQSFSRAQQDLDMESRALTNLCAVHDHCRLGALRVRPQGKKVSTLPPTIELPSHVDLDVMFTAITAFEQGEADPRQLGLLLSSATSLGGSRPKISFLQDNGSLAVAKFPSVSDTYPVTKAEALVSQLAKVAGLQVVEVRLQHHGRGSVAITQRFDRRAGDGRQPYLSARSMLLAEEGEEVSILDLLNGMRTFCKDFSADARQLWHRLMFNCLINSADASLRKIGFLYSGGDRWRLAPAVGLAPGMEPRTGEATPSAPEPGLLGDVEALLRMAPAFGLSQAEALGILAYMVEVIGRWRTVAAQFAVRMKPVEMDMLEGAMNSVHLQQARERVGKRRA